MHMQPGTAPASYIRKGNSGPAVASPTNQITFHALLVVTKTALSSGAFMAIT